MAQDYLSLLQSALVSSQKKKVAPPKSVQYQIGQVAGKNSIQQPGAEYEALSNPTPQSDGFQLGDLNPIKLGTGLMGHYANMGMRAIDLLQRGNYGTANQFQKGVADVRAGDPSLQNGESLGFMDMLKAAGAGINEPGEFMQGFTGKEKITGANVVEDALGDSADEKSGLGKGVAGLSIDIFGDPTSYIAGAGLLKLLKYPMRAATNVAEEAAEETVEQVARTAPPIGAPVKTSGANPQRVLFGKDKQFKTKTPSAIPASKLAEPQATFDPPVVGEQLDLFATPATKAPPDIKAPSVTFGPKTTAPVETVTDAVPPNFVAPQKMIDNLKNYNLPIPVGRELTESGERIYAEGTEAVFTAAKSARVLAEKVVLEDKSFVEAAKKAVGVEDLKTQYKNGEIRPAIDTPAEREFLHQLNRANKVESYKMVDDPKNPGTLKEVTSSSDRGATYGLQKFNHLPVETRAVLTKAGAYSENVRPRPKLDDYVDNPSGYDEAMTTWSNEVTSFANPEISVRINGKSAKITSDQLWKVLNGENIPISHRGTSNASGKGTGARVITPAQVELLTNLGSTSSKGKKSWVSAADIAKQNEKVLNSKQYWKDSAELASKRMRRPDAIARNIARAEIDAYKGEAKRLKDSLDEWLKQAKINHPELSEKTLREAHKAGRELLAKMWDQANAQKANPAEFIKHKKVITEVQSIMTSAVLRHATPEELLTDLAIANQKIVKIEAEGLLKVVKASADENPEFAAKVAEKADDMVTKADEAIETAEQAEKVAKAERVVEAQGNATAVRVAEVTNKVDDNVEDILKVGGGSSNWVDAGVGAVRSITKMTLENIRGDRIGKRFPAYNQMKQTKTILAAKEAVARYGRGKRMSPEMRLARTIQLVRATEHQLGTLGHYPNVWNGLKGKARANIDFSAADLLDDMLKINPTLAAKALSEPNFNHVLQGALLKDKAALSKITDDELVDFLIKYDAAANTSGVKMAADASRAQTIGSGTSVTAKAAQESAVLDSPGRQALNAANAGKDAKEAVKNTPGAPVEVADATAEGAKKAVADVIEAVSPASKVSKAIDSQKNALISPDQIKANKASQNGQRAAGATPAKAGEVIDEAAHNKTWVNMFDGILKHFANHTGAKTMYPLYQDAFGRLSAYIGDTARWWETLTKQHPEEAMVLAFKSLQPGMAPPTDEAAAAALREVRGRMEAILGGSDIKKYIAGNTTVTRAGIEMHTLNKWLRQKAVKTPDGKLFQFKTTLDDGTEFKGAEWITQWEQEIAKFNDADAGVHFLHNLESAIQGSVTERIYFNDLAIRFGKKAGAEVDHPYLRGIKFDPEMAAEAKRVIEILDMLQFPKPSGKWWSTYDQLLRMWKTGVTIYNPIHHIKNFTGDSFLLFGDGGKIRHYGKAAQLHRDFRGSKIDPGALHTARGASLENVTDIEQLRKLALEGPAEGKKVVKNKATGVTFTDEQVMSMGALAGIYQNAGNTEDIMQAGSNFISQLGNKFPRLNAPLGGKGHRTATTVAEGREHLVRTAHFVHALETSAVKKTAKMTEKQYRELVMEDAARRVRKFHPDGMDLTAFERKYMRRMIPFYSWQRKSIPLIMLISVKRPALVTAYPKAQEAVSYGSGNLDPNNRNPENRMFPGGEIYPDFLTGSPYAIVGDSPEGGTRVASGPSTPAIDFFDMLNNPMGSTMGMMTPFATGPLSLAYEKDPRTGAPLESLGDKAKYVAGQIPGIGVGTRWGTNKQSGIVDFVNWMTGAGQMDTGPYRKSAEFDARERAKREAANR